MKFIEEAEKENVRHWKKRKKTSLFFCFFQIYDSSIKSNRNWTQHFCLVYVVRVGIDRRILFFGNLMQPPSWVTNDYHCAQILYSSRELAGSVWRIVTCSVVMCRALDFDFLVRSHGWRDCFTQYFTQYFTQCTTEISLGRPYYNCLFFFPTHLSIHGHKTRDFSSRGTYSWQA